MCWRPPPNDNNLSPTTTILESRFPHLEGKGISEQRPPVNNGHYFWVPRMVVIHRFDCIFFVQIADCGLVYFFPFSFKTPLPLPSLPIHSPSRSSAVHFSKQIFTCSTKRMTFYWSSFNKMIKPLGSVVKNLCWF